jgi:nucleoside 2-deoxyribosyltransferase/predicted RNA-binding Zn-ribbon protein involved in translation (DUF1610 family)
MKQSIFCPICKLGDEEKVSYTSGEGSVTYKCARCGRFTITRTAEATAEDKNLSSKITAWIKEHNERGDDCPKITSDTLENVEKNIPDYSPMQKQLILLKNIERRSSYPGHTVVLTPKFDYPLSWAIGEEEFYYYVNSLVERGFLKRTDNYIIEEEKPSSLSVVITPKGWSYLDENSKKAVISDQVFVAMSFSPSLKSSWENGIRPAIIEAGYRPYRVDVEPHIDRIDAKIITEIKNSRFLVADVTEQKQGVYFEAGFALGLGIPVIWCVKKDDLDNVHFDTRQYNHIVWESDKDLRENLYYLICSVIGKY